MILWKILSSVRVKNTATRQRYEQNSGEVQGGLPIEKDTISGTSLGEPRANLKAVQKTQDYAGGSLR